MKRCTRLTFRKINLKTNRRYGYVERNCESKSDSESFGNFNGFGRYTCIIPSRHKSGEHKMMSFRTDGRSVRHEYSSSNHPALQHGSDHSHDDSHSAYVDTSVSFRENASETQRNFENQKALESSSRSRTRSESVYM